MHKTPVIDVYAAIQISSIWLWLPMAEAITILKKMK